MHDRRMAVTLDGTDPLRAFHQRFIVAPDELIYFDGNSLGRLPGTPRAGWRTSSGASGASA